MSDEAFVIARDARGSLIHVRRHDDGQCIGCIEVGLYEIVRGLILAEGVEKGGGGDGRWRRTRSLDTVTA